MLKCSSVYLAFDKANLQRSSDLFHFYLLSSKGEPLLYRKDSKIDKLPLFLEKQCGKMPEIIIWEDQYKILPFLEQPYLTELREEVAETVGMRPEEGHNIILGTMQCDDFEFKIEKKAKLELINNDYIQSTLKYEALSLYYLHQSYQTYFF